VTPPIEVRQRPDGLTRTPGKSCVYVAEAPVSGVTYTGRARMGAPHELARILVAAGIADAPMQVHSQGLAGHMTYRSFHQMAGFTLKENASTPVHRVRWEDPAAIAAQFGDRNRESLASSENSGPEYPGRRDGAENAAPAPL
jgi:hypothetical protein